ncbi:MAG TPA: hypothetical protein VIH90_00590 [Candidatus Saccharimonadales bacterium]
MVEAHQTREQRAGTTEARFLTRLKGVYEGFQLARFNWLTSLSRLKDGPIPGPNLSGSVSTSFSIGSRQITVRREHTDPNYYTDWKITATWSDTSAGGDLPMDITAVEKEYFHNPDPIPGEEEKPYSERVYSAEPGKKSMGLGAINRILAEVVQEQSLYPAA